MDFNLLKGLDALLEQCSVQEAAIQLNLTQPAVSRVLARLRDATGDEILVRNGREMVPTPRALELREEVRDLVTRAGMVLTPPAELRLADLSRTFVIRCHDSFLVALAPRLTQELARVAPGVRVRFIGENPADSRELSRGVTDLTVGCPAEQGSPSIETLALKSDEMVLIVANGHDSDVARPSAAHIANALHVDVSRQANPHGPVDTALAELGLRRKVVATVPTVAAALAVAATSTAVAIVPRRLRDPLPPGLRARPLPFVLTTAPVTVNWHRRHGGDPAHVWLRDLVAGLLEDLLEREDA